MMHLRQSRFMALCQENRKKKFSEISDILSQSYTELGRGELGVVFEATGRAAKVYKNSDKGFNNYVRSCRAAHAFCKGQAWTQHLPTIYIHEQYEHFSFILTEKLVPYYELEEEFPHNIKTFIRGITPKPSILTLEDALKEVAGRFIYKGILEQNARSSVKLNTKGKDHYQVTEALDEVMDKLMDSCMEYGTVCDLSPQNNMFRCIGSDNFQLVISDPFTVTNIY